MTITYLLAVTMEINVADLEVEERRDLLRRIVCHERGNLRKDFSKVNSLCENLDVLNSLCKENLNIGQYCQERDPLVLV